MRIAVVGGGINGVMCAWQLRERGYDVDLFERATLMGATSSASTKLLHGGLRYLEHGDLALVREGLHERAWWLANAPHLAHPLELFFPLYRNSPRSRVVVGIGLALYDILAGDASLGRHRWWPRGRIPEQARALRSGGLLGVFSFVDAQMDDRALGMWAAERAATAGVRMFERTPVRRISLEGELDLADGRRMHFDMVVNAAGPWARLLLAESGIPSHVHLDLVRGSHLVVQRALSGAFAVQLASDARLVFALPYHGRTLVGTTEVRQALDEPIACSDAERAYLIAAFNNSFEDAIGPADVESSFAGLRPLVDAGRSAHAQRRGSLIEVSGHIITVFGGKWTTSHALGAKVADRVQAISRCSARQKPNAAR